MDSTKVTKPKGSPYGWGAVVVVVACLLVVVSAIGRFRSSKTPDQGPCDNATDALAGGELGSKAQGSVPGAALLVDDPQKDGWQSEAFSEAASAQLKLIAKWLASPGDLSSGEVSRLAAPEFACTGLRADVPELVFEHERIRIERRVERSEPDDSDSSERMLRGADGFFEALQDLFEPYRVASEQKPGQRGDVRAEFKITGVVLGSDQVETSSYVTLSGFGSEGPMEETSTWACTWTRESPPRLTKVRCEGWERVRVAEDRLFSDCTEAVLQRDMTEDDLLGHGLPHWYARVQQLFGQSPLGYHGLAVGDVNADGLDDVYLCNPGGLPNQLFLQNPDGTVSEQAAEAGVDWMDTTTSALFIDLDNDSDQDLIVGSSPVMVLENVGPGDTGRVRFTGRMLLPGPAVPTSITATDIDRDGLLDLYICYYSNEAPLPYHDASNGPPNLLWRNAGAWRFENETSKFGLDQNNSHFSFAACWEDYDNDGDLDLYVANDYGRNNLYRNDGDRFRDVAAQAGVEDISAGMSVSWGDYDRDGWMDLYVSNMFSTAGNRITYQREFNPSADSEQRAAMQRHARGNSLFRGRPSGRFEDVSRAAGVTMGRWAWCSLFLDINNDALQDIVVANGNLTNESSKDL